MDGGVNPVWVHFGVPRSMKFMCSACGGFAYYPQACHTRLSNPNRDKLVMKYKRCPYCGVELNEIISEYAWIRSGGRNDGTGDYRKD